MRYDYSSESAETKIKITETALKTMIKSKDEDIKRYHDLIELHKNFPEMVQSHKNRLEVHETEKGCYEYCLKLLSGKPHR